MTTECTMPMLGEVMTEGTVVSWKKTEGQPVAKGEVLLEVETDKAVMGVESPASGVLKAILVKEGRTVPVHTPLALIEEAMPPTGQTAPRAS
jgi:pyruvate/2-oxoglutarate dehydrogenase complex dihydrolipoamide acyltransferase (E2) component